MLKMTFFQIPFLCVFSIFIVDPGAQGPIGAQGGPKKEFLTGYEFLTGTCSEILAQDGPWQHVGLRARLVRPRLLLLGARFISLAPPHVVPPTSMLIIHNEIWARAALATHKICHVDLRFQT